MNRLGYLGFEEYEGMAPKRKLGLGNFGASGAMKWYWGQHAKVCNDMKSGNLKQAILDASLLNDLGIEKKTYEEVIISEELLRSFKNAFNSQKGKMTSYDDAALNQGNALIDAAIESNKPKVTITGTIDCGPNKPASGPDFFYACCPGGWTKAAYGDKDACRGQAPLVGQAGGTPEQQAALVQQISQPILMPGPSLDVPQTAIDTSKVPMIIGIVGILFVVTVGYKLFKG